MDISKIKDYCAQKPGSWEDQPFGPDTLVFKVTSKMYGLIGLDDDPKRMNLKCDPQEAEALRAMHESIIPGYHMNKEHWNTVILDGSLPDELIFRLIDESYILVIRKLSKSDRAKLKII